MTPTTPERARELARDAALDLGCIRRAIGSLADQVEALTKERDEQRHAADHWMAEATRDHNALQKLIPERDALAAAAKLALEATVLLNGDAHLMMMSDDGPAGTYANKVFHKTCLSIEALRQAGVQ